MKARRKFAQNSARPADNAEAVTGFIASSEHLIRAASGQRARLSAKYAYNREIRLRKFADTLSYTLVCDMSKEH